MKKLKAVNRAVEKLEQFFIVASLTLMVVLTFLHIVLRTLYIHLHIPWANMLLGRTDWTEPLVRLLVLWITFLGASLLTVENRHIKIDILRSLPFRKWLPFRETLISTCCTIICAFMFKSSIDYIRLEIEFGQNVFLGIPSWICQVILPAGFLVMSFRFFLNAMDHFLILMGKGEL